MSFGERNFAAAQLGDLRRTQRLVKTADLMTRRPGGSLPQKLNDPKDLKAFYRLMNCDQVTHQAILAPHREATRERIAQSQSPVLILHDATELDFTSHRSLEEELGQIGNGYQRGYITHNSLAVEATTRRVLGLCNQILHHRADVAAEETSAQKRERQSRESRLWLQGTEPLGSSWQLIDVCDQGADTFEFLEHELNSGRRFVVRAAYDRGIVIGHGAAASSRSGNLRSFARELAPAATWELPVRRKIDKKAPKKKGKKQLIQRTARQATLAVAFAPIQIKPPGKRKGNHGNEPLKVWVVRVWELNPPQGQEPLEWFLITNEPVLCSEEARRVVGWYECRWIVEEYHKGMKTGCSIESPQFTTQERLQPAIALISIVTLTLLEMRDASRQSDAPSRLASELISDDYIWVLSAWRHGVIKPEWSVHDFFYALARLGGHQNRKHDHPPGWQTIWKGWTDLQAMVCGAEAMKSISNCG